jgi:hypothetical protein
MSFKATRVLNRKTKMITFRVSPEDYEKLRIYCLTKGQRSVSDLARLAVSTVLENGAAPSLETRLADVEGRLHLLSRELLRMAPADTQHAIAQQGASCQPNYLSDCA